MLLGDIVQVLVTPALTDDGVATGKVLQIVAMAAFRDQTKGSKKKVQKIGYFLLFPIIFSPNINVCILGRKIFSN